VPVFKCFQMGKMSYVEREIVREGELYGGVCARGNVQGNILHLPWRGKQVREKGASS